MRIYIFSFCLMLGVSPALAGQADVVYNVEKFNTQGFLFGTHYIKGYVVQRNHCPECSTGAFCKPCAPESIVISDVRRFRKSSELTSRQAIIFVEDSRAFDLGVKYTFLIHVLDVENNTSNI